MEQGRWKRCRVANKQYANSQYELRLAELDDGEVYPIVYRLWSNGWYLPIQM